MTVIAGADGDAADAEDTNPATRRAGVGEAYVFTRGNDDWSHTATLANPEPDEFDSFGGSSAISEDGTIAVIGAPTDGDPSAGEAYVFARSDDDWRHAATLSNPDPDEFDRFGGSVAVSGDGTTAIVGAITDNRGTGETDASVQFDVGEAYVCTRSGGEWHHTDTLSHPKPDSFDLFGRSVGISDDGATVVVGAPREAVGASYFISGEAYVFEGEK